MRLILVKQKDKVPNSDFYEYLLHVIRIISDFYELVKITIFQSMMNHLLCILYLLIP